MRALSTGQWEEEVFADLRYRVLLPHDYSPEKKYPLVVFLHGSGERGSDNVAQLTKGVGAFNTRHVRARFPCIVVAPQAPAGGSFGGAWYPGLWATQDAVARLTRELSGRRTVDVERMYLAGLSMGAIGGWELLVRHPGLFAAAMLVCGEPKVAWAEALSGVSRLPRRRGARGASEGALRGAGAARQSREVDGVPRPRPPLVGSRVRRRGRVRVALRAEASLNRFDLRTTVVARAARATVARDGGTHVLVVDHGDGARQRERRPAVFGVGAKPV
jgi:pimeloyl-ACP methyl ester carboxylesterase